MRNLQAARQYAGAFIMRAKLRGATNGISKSQGRIGGRAMTSIAQQTFELSKADQITGAHTVYDSPWSEHYIEHIRQKERQRDLKQRYEARKRASDKLSDAIRRKDTRDQHKAQKALTAATTACLIAEAGR